MGSIGTQRTSRRFIVRMWCETVDGVGQHRGDVRDVDSGAFAAFSEWSALTGFLEEQFDETADRRAARRRQP